MIALALSRILELGATVMEEWPTIRELIGSVNTMITTWLPGPDFQDRAGSPLCTV